MVLYDQATVVSWWKGQPVYRSVLVFTVQAVEKLNSAQESGKMHQKN